ncbi:hypothetical protein EG68_10767 [Paragonimus skrjabini miyazakii]|uniref:MutL C-terminal dimerisation domain-containing protein n=1 Tax=Paragonimus skrjabini miyazakii TaxID=59628 RepID=A0A8S9YA85_9TREM|nr:hypothetical protein EG68_10767 [Paragonimus skrjabini miyazakii]
MLLLHHERYVLALTKTILVNTLFQTTGIDIASLSHGDLSQSMISPSTYSPSSAAPLDNSVLTARKRPSSSAYLVSPSIKRASLISIVNLDSLSQSMTDFSTTTPLRASGPADFYDRSTAVATELIIPETDNNDSQAAQVITDELLSNMGSLVSHSVSANFSMVELHKRWHATAKAANAHLWSSHSHPSTEFVQSNEQTDSGIFSLGQFRATQTEALESELSTYFSKSSFTDLHVVGQFNLGFIIALHRDDLFIIDQHASDEKFRFEQLCDTYQFTCQPLITPQALELSVEQEQLLLNNLDVFAKNGFAFQVNESAPCGQQIQLTATPMLENKVFGRPDIEEMLFVLSESYSRRCRPSRLRDILASRSCRSAVMIGTALDHAKMLRIVRNMGTMHHPWNCPHGRPTMRHLFHLGRLGAE